MSATLASLRIRNLALVEELFWEPPAGFVAITGETGAGKSVILGAIKLLIGERADKSLVRSGADSCMVEGVFEIHESPALHRILEDAGVEPCEESRLIIKRTMSTAGSGKQFVNGSACTLQLLRQLGDLLVDLHGPHDHQSLFSRDHQLMVLDSFAAAESLRRDFSEKRRQWMNLVAEKKRLTENAEALARETDLLSHQVNEIESADLKPGEEKDLVSRQRSTANAQRLCSLCSDLTALISDSDDSIISRWSDVSRLVKELHRLDDRTVTIAESAAGVFESVQDLARDLDRFSSSLDSNPESLSILESRLDTIQNLKRKYGASEEAVLEFGKVASEKLSGLRNREERGAGLDAEIAQAKNNLDEVGRTLTEARRNATPDLVALVKRHLSDLGFAKAGFSITFENLLEPGPLGTEHVEFLFAPNPGEPERPLRSIASSGEISRVMLALKTSLAAQDSVPILVFDEIDANVGGEIGAKVGAKMQELGATHQVFCITHLPQVAAGAGSQFLVTKETSSNRTRTTLTPAMGEARIHEIARMLGGKMESARDHALALLSWK